MDAHDAIYAVLAANGNTVSGSTVIDKIIYLSSRKIPELDVPPYTEHYYGPFSPGVRWTLEKMILYSFLYETGTPGVVYDRYAYSLTDDGKKMAERAQKEHRDGFGKISGIVAACRDLCGMRNAPLSYASKIHYLLTQESGEYTTFDDAVGYARKLGWKVSEDNVDQGASLLEELQLARP